MTLAALRRRRSVAPALNTATLPQHEVLEDELAFAAWKWPAANAAGDLTIDRLGTGCLPYHLVQRIAGWTCKRRFHRHEIRPSTVHIMMWLKVQP